MAGPAVFFVPLVIAGGKVFFKFATKKAAQAFKGRFAKAGSVTTRTPPKSATVTTTGSNKGKSIIQDMTKPVTKPTISPRNPNTSTLPKPPKSSGGGAKAAGAAATGAGVAAGSTATGKDADKPKKSKPSKTSDQARSEARVADRQSKLAAKSAAQGGGSVLSNKKKKRDAAGTYDRSAVATSKPKGKPTTKPTPPPKRPKKSSKVTTPTSKPKLYSTIDPKTGKEVDKKVTMAQHLANLDAAKKKGLLIGSQRTKAARLKAAKEIEAKIKKLTKGKK